MTYCDTGRLERAAIQSAEEAACGAGMACGAGWDGLQPKAILIAIDQNFPNAQHMARCFALHPKRLAGSRPEMRPPRLPCFRDCLRVHMGDHQHNAGFGMGDDSRQQAFFIEFGLEHICHAANRYPEMTDCLATNAAQAPTRRACEQPSAGRRSFSLDGQAEPWRRNSMAATDR